MLDALPARGEWLYAWEDAMGNLLLQTGLAAADGAAYLLRFPGQCDFLLEPFARRVSIDAVDGLGTETLEHLLLDQTLPRLLAHWGHTVVHGSVVRVGKGCVLFLGRSGWGKSTLAGLLQEHGLPALCDDCALLDVRDGQVFTTPSYPGLRLFDESIAQVFETAPETSPVASYSDKQRVAHPAGQADLQAEHPVVAIYLLGDPAESDGRLSIEPLTAAAACMALVEHSFRLDPTDRAQSGAQLRRAAALAHAMPAFALRYPHDFSRQGEVLRMLLGHIEGLATTAGC